MADLRKRFELPSDDTDLFEVYEEHKSRHSIHSIPTSFSFLFLIFLIAFCNFVRRLEDQLPTPRTVQEEKIFPFSFITERAQHDLRMLTEIGPRVVGSYENEGLAVDFLKREITIIQHMMDPSNKLEMDVQVVSGSYFFDFKPNGAINAYAYVQNVVVKLFAANDTDVSLLINAHFDSVPSSPGGSDDGINCAVMLEILRKLSRSPVKFKHNIIFLFNGAEESALHASHGFITQHKWSHEVRAFINLDSGGAEGKEELFQMTEGSSWLMEYYKQVPYPQAQAAAEELFQSGIIPSDTDFRIFRDFGKVPGMDFAFIRNGYRYHTRFDGFANIPGGSYQHVGDNILTLVRNLANAPELLETNPQSKGQVVYYDFLGLFLVAYSTDVAFFLNIGVALLSLFTARRSLMDFGSGKSMKYIVLNAGVILFGWISSLVSVLMVGSMMDMFRSPMGWYAHPWVIMGLYIVPIVFCCIASLALLKLSGNNKNWSISVQTQIQMHLVRMIWSLLLLIGTLMGYRFVYAILIPVLFQTIGFIIIRTLSSQYSVRTWQVIYLLSTVIPTTFLIAQSLKLFYVIIPICGRMGSDRNPEFYIAILAYIMGLLITSAYTPLITLVRQPLVLLYTLIGLFLLSFVFVFTPVGFPYTGNPASPAPQRFMVFHTGRAFRNDSNDLYKRDSGFFIINMDRNAHCKVGKYVRDIHNAQSIEHDCKEVLFCGLPLMTTLMIPTLHESIWIPAGWPIIHEHMHLSLNSKVVFTDNLIRFNFTLSGPNRLVVYISPRPMSKLIATSLANEISTDPAIWNERPAYAILYTTGLENPPLTFTLDIQAPPNWDKPTLDLAVSVRYIHDKTHIKTPYFLKLLRDFPPWADVVGALGYYENWVF